MILQNLFNKNPLNTVFKIYQDKNLRAIKMSRVKIVFILYKKYYKIYVFKACFNKDVMNVIKV